MLLLFTEFFNQG